MGQEAFDTGSYRDYISLGLLADHNSEAYQYAEEIQAKLNTGRKVTNIEMGQLTAAVYADALGVGEKRTEETREDTDYFIWDGVFDEDIAFKRVLEGEQKPGTEFGNMREVVLSDSALEDIIAYEPDIYIGNNVGAKLKDTLVQLPNGEKVVLTPGKKISQVQTIAGAGRNRKIDMVNDLLLRYPGTKEELWEKRKGFGYVDYDGESFLVDLHWYEEPTVGRVEFKVKPDAGGNWFYEEE